jgi:hypothetical protein
MIQQGEDRLQAIIDYRHEMAESYMRGIEAGNLHWSGRTFWDVARE